MQSQPTAGVDLPIRIAVWENEAGHTFVITKSNSLVKRHGLWRSELTGVNTAVANFVNAATTPALQRPMGR